MNTANGQEASLITHTTDTNYFICLLCPLQ